MLGHKPVCEVKGPFLTETTYLELFFTHNIFQ